MFVFSLYVIFFTQFLSALGSNICYECTSSGKHFLEAADDTFLCVDTISKDVHLKKILFYEDCDEMDQTIISYPVNQMNLTKPLQTTSTISSTKEDLLVYGPMNFGLTTELPVNPSNLIKPFLESQLKDESSIPNEFWSKYKLSEKWGGLYYGNRFIIKPFTQKKTFRLLRNLCHSLRLTTDYIITNSMYKDLRFMTFLTRNPMTNRGNVCELIMRNNNMESRSSNKSFINKGYKEFGLSLSKKTGRLRFKRMYLLTVTKSTKGFILQMLKNYCYNFILVQKYIKSNPSELDLFPLLEANPIKGKHTLCFRLTGRKM